MMYSANFGTKPHTRRVHSDDGKAKIKTYSISSLVLIFENKLWFDMLKLQLI